MGSALPCEEYESSMGTGLYKLIHLSDDNSQLLKMEYGINQQVMSSELQKGSLDSSF